MNVPQNGITDHEIDDIYDTVDEMLWAGQFQEIEQMIELLYSDSWSACRCLTWLTATLPEKARLSKSRAVLIKHIKRNETDAVNLLRGLE